MSNKARRLSGAYLLFLALTWPSLRLSGNSGDPPLNSTGSPGDVGRSCSQSGCHSGGPAGSSGNIGIFGLPASYAPQTDYQITVTVSTSPGQTRPGFMVTVENAANAAAGTFSGFDANSQARGDSAAHRNASAGVDSWTFTWRSPAAGAGTVTLYSAANAANGDGGTGGDRIDLRSVAVAEASASTSAGSLPSAPVLSGVSLSSTSIRWNWELQAGVTDYFLRSSTGLIASLPSSVSTYVEAALPPGTLHGRLLRASNDTGTADSLTTSVATADAGVDVPAGVLAAFTIFGATVSLPAGALGGAGSALGSDDPVSRPLLPSTPGDVSSANSALSGLALVPGSLRQFLAYKGGVRYTTDFVSGVTVSIGYLDTDGDGFVDGTFAAPEQLTLYSLQEGGGRWVPVPGSAVDAPARTVTASVAHFSVFALLGATGGSALDDVFVFPNPLRPAQGHTKMNFTRMPAGSSLRIYSLSGEAVRGLSPDADGTARWDGTNANGRRAASGVYFAVLRGGGEKRVLRVMIQR